MSTMLVCSYGSVVQSEIWYYDTYSIAFFCLGLFYLFGTFCFPVDLGISFLEGVKNVIGSLLTALTLGRFH